MCFFKREFFFEKKAKKESVPLDVNCEIVALVVRAKDIDPIGKKS